MCAYYKKLTHYSLCTLVCFLCRRQAVALCQHRYWRRWHSAACEAHHMRHTC